MHKEKLLVLENICRNKDGTMSSVCNSTEFNCRRDIPVFFLVFEDNNLFQGRRHNKTTVQANTLNKLKLIGYLGVFLPEESTAELNVLIHPDYRRQGIFTELLKRAKAALSAIGTKKFVFVCEPSSSDATAAMLAMKAKKRSSEYQMFLESSAHISLSFRNMMSAINSSETSKAKRKQVLRSLPGELLEATLDDLPLLGRMNALFFGTSEEMGELFAEDSYYTPGITVYKYVITNENKKTVPIGTVCFCEEAHSGNIFGLGVLPEYRGHGYGKDLLQELLSRIPTDKKIYLQVSSRNAAAFQLYQKAGFKIIAQQDFWFLP